LTYFEIPIPFTICGLLQNTATGCDDGCIKPTRSKPACITVVEEVAYIWTP
jgi:hypothetical protein